MKYLLCAFLMILCFTSSIAGDTEYAQENTSAEVESGDLADSDEKSLPLYDTLEDFIFCFASDFRIFDKFVNTRFTYPSDSFCSFELDYFCPPPNYFSPVFTLR